MEKKVSEFVENSKQYFEDDNKIFEQESLTELMVYCHSNQLFQRYHQHQHGFWLSTKLGSLQQIRFQDIFHSAFAGFDFCMSLPIETVGKKKKKDQ